MQSLKNIKLIFFDFDGVFTDNAVYVDENGRESVRCNRSDGLGIEMLRKIGLAMCIVSTETNPVVAARAAKLRLPVFQACTNKAQFVRDFMAQRQISPADTAFVGNDINDLEAMKSVGIRVCPADAYPDILTIANVRLTKTGGHGAVRELCELVLLEKQ